MANSDKHWSKMVSGKKKKRLHYGNKISGLFPGACFKSIIAIMYVFFFFFKFSCGFGGNNMVLRMVSKDEIKNRSTRDKCLGVKVWRNWMDAHHVAGGEPLSLG